MKIGFDHNKYLEEQSKFIEERVNNYDKLYLEFGGKLMFDLHAKRVLPGFDENAKIKVLSKLKDKVEVIICVYAGDIERNKIRGDFGITYDMEVFRLIDDLRAHELQVNSVVITRYEERPSTALFITKLERRGIKVYKHMATKGYPTDIDAIVSDDGYGKNPYIETERPIVVVTAPGPGSGKLATCLGQLYHEYKRGKSAGYSKFETFPVWNLPLKHPLNIAYEAATIDLADVNMIDPFHLETYGETTINYNRDIEAFLLLKRIIEKITGKESVYKSPTDMGVNRVGFGIIDDEVVQEASKQEIIRRYFNAGCEYKKGYIDYPTFQRAELIMRNLNLTEENRKCVAAARQKAESSKRADPDLPPDITRPILNGTLSVAFFQAFCFDILIMHPSSVCSTSSSIFSSENTFCQWDSMQVLQCSLAIRLAPTRAKDLAPPIWPQRSRLTSTKPSPSATSTWLPKRFLSLVAMAMATLSGSSKPSCLKVAATWRAPIS